jgi:hypothetical protein
MATSACLANAVASPTRWTPTSSVLCSPKRGNPRNIARDLKSPPTKRSKAVEIELDDVKRIVDGATSPFGALFALLYGAGVGFLPRSRASRPTSTRNAEKSAPAARRHTPGTVLRA